MAKSQQVTMAPKEERRPGLLGGILKAFIPMAASSLGGPYAGAAAKAGMGFLSGDAKQTAEGGSDLLSAATGVEGEGDQKTPNSEEDDPVIPDDEPTEGQPPQQQQQPAPIAVNDVPYTPDQMQEQEQLFQFMEQQAPNLPVFLAQNPDFFPATKGFLSQMEARYKR